MSGIRKSYIRSAINTGYGYPLPPFEDIPYLNLLAKMKSTKGSGKTRRRNPSGLVKGSPEAKAYMARLRAMRKMKGKGKVGDWFKNLFRRGKKKVQELTSNPEKIRQTMEKIKQGIDVGRQQLSDPNSKLNEYYKMIQQKNLPPKLKSALEKGMNFANQQVKDSNSYFNQAYNQVYDPQSKLNQMYNNILKKQWQEEKDRNQVMFDNQF